MNILELLNSNKLHNLIINMNICEDYIIRTRNIFKRSTSSCRLWQFKLAITNYYLKNDITFIENETSIMDICNIVNSFINDSSHINTLLHNIIIYNQPINIMPILSIDNLYSNYSDTQLFYMCIYNQNQNLVNSSIIHFFTIIRINSNYFLNSSYGSEYVCVPQYTTKLDIEEFNLFCFNLVNKIPEFQKFYLKYFLQNNMKVRYNNNNINIDKSLKSKYISKDEGIFKENNFILNSSNTYYVGLINNYETNIDSLVEKFIKNKNESVLKSIKKTKTSKSPYKSFTMNGGKSKKKKKKSI